MGSLYGSRLPFSGVPGKSPLKISPFLWDVYLEAPKFVGLSVGAECVGFPQGFHQVQQEIRGLGTLRPAKPAVPQIVEFESWKFWISKDFSVFLLADCLFWFEGWNRIWWWKKSLPLIFSRPLYRFVWGEMEESNGMNVTRFLLVLYWW